ncbi:transmembrane protein 170A-like [Hydractinia symbiolongicarpus]|uniref:transmembrane protein 170A-like n=1 Tax=Hydractinia symbiolongicarpus TaxID=13093 RepID=UPI00254E6408|nr:transmembrane protein 170A-like [Hydractinia symbiolongicarpus]
MNTTATPQQIRTTENSDDLVSFKDISYQIFLYCLATTVLVHGLAALLALRSLRTHKIGRYLSILLFVSGFLYPLTGGIITMELEHLIACNIFLHKWNLKRLRCCIAWIYSAAGYRMGKPFAFFFGGGQTLVLVVVSFSRVYGTL